MKEAFSSLVIYSMMKKPEEEKQLGRPRSTWEGDNKVGLKEIEQKEVLWIIMAQEMETWHVLETNLPFNKMRDFFFFTI